MKIFLLKSMLNTQNQTLQKLAYTQKSFLKAKVVFPERKTNFYDRKYRINKTGFKTAKNRRLSSARWRDCKLPRDYRSLT